MDVTTVVCACDCPGAVTTITLACVTTDAELGLVVAGEVFVVEVPMANVGEEEVESDWALGFESESELVLGFDLAFELGCELELEFEPEFDTLPGSLSNPVRETDQKLDPPPVD